MCHFIELCFEFKKINENDLHTGQPFDFHFYFHTKNNDLYRYKVLSLFKFDKKIFDELNDYVITKAYKILEMDLLDTFEMRLFLLFDKNQFISLKKGELSLEEILNLKRVILP